MIEPSMLNYSFIFVNLFKNTLLSYSSIFRFIPKRFEPSELKKVRLQEEMSGLKHQFSIENEPNLHSVSSPAKDDDKEIDPVDECNLYGIRIRHT